MIHVEEWRDVVGYEGLYSISNHGRVRREVTRTCARAGNLLTVRSKPAGYQETVLYLSGRRRTFLVHVLVAAAFIGPCPEGMEVNHKNGKKSDNSSSNLEYLTPLENARHAVANGLYRPSHGQKNGAARLSDEQVRWIRRIFRHGRLAYRQIGNCFAVRGECVRRIIKGERWAGIT